MTVVLYRCRTPTNWLCPCGRVKRELVKAGEDVREVRVPWAKDDRREVRALTGQTVVPVAVIDGDAICDSRRIRQHLSKRAQPAPEPTQMD